MEANASDEGVHFQSYPFDFLEFLNHQRFEPMEAYNQEHAKAVASLPCPQPPYEYPPPPAGTSHFDRPAPAKPKDFKAEGPAPSASGAAQPKKAEPGAGPPQQYSAAAVPAAPPLFDGAGAFGAPQWGIVDLSGHQHLFGSLKRGVGAAPAPAAPADSPAGKDDKNYFRRLKYFIDRRFPCGVCQKSFKQSSHLVQHMLVHTGERPYECSTCGRTYNHISSLIRHRRCHKEPPEAGPAAAAAPPAAAAGRPRRGHPASRGRQPRPGPPRWPLHLFPVLEGLQEAKPPAPAPDHPHRRAALQLLCLREELQPA
ncbi:unnamed protein product [Eretmochelys imbricata]